MRAVRRKLAVEGIEVAPETGVEYDPDSNGSAECGVGLAKGRIRTVRHGLVERLGQALPEDHPLISWMI